MNLEHYKFFFNSVTDNSEKYIVLDVTYESNKYPRIIEKRIESSELNVKSDLFVRIPSIESILGDKLTVLAPRTIGISYNSEKELELMKQLYDVDKLFNETENVKEVIESFINIANRKIKYRKLHEITYIDVLADIEDFTKDIIFRENKDNLNKITIGIRKFTNFMLEKKFLIDREALIAASKVLYLVYLIRNDEDKIYRYGRDDVEKVEIPREYKKRLKVIEIY